MISSALYIFSEEGVIITVSWPWIFSPLILSQNLPMAGGWSALNGNALNYFHTSNFIIFLNGFVVGRIIIKDTFHGQTERNICRGR